MVTEAKSNHLIQLVFCNNRERLFNCTLSWVAKRVWQWKSTNWGRTRKKWKLVKPDFWQRRRETASSNGLRSRESSAWFEPCERDRSIQRAVLSFTAAPWLSDASECPEKLQARDRKLLKKMHWKRNVYKASKTRTKGTHHILLNIFAW